MGMAPGFLTPSHLFSSLLTLTLKPPPPMLKILLFIVTSHSPPSIQLNIPAHPPPTCSTEEEATITTWDPRNILAWAPAGA